jgi:hypothetical protein
VAHIGLHHVQTKLVHHLAQFLHTFLVGGDLRVQVGHVLLRIATWEFTALQQSQHRGLAQHAPVHQLEVDDLHALLLDAGEKGGMEPGVVPPTSAWWPRLPT